MGSYDIEYKKYYDELKKKNSIPRTEYKANYDYNNYIHSKNLPYSKVKNDKKDKFIGSLLIMQLVGTTMLFLFVFGVKYSSNENISKYYNKFKQAIEEEHIYVNGTVDEKKIDFNYIQNKIIDSLEWVKEKFQENKF